MPALVAEKLPVSEFAERAGVNTQTASRFLKEKAEDFALSNKVKFLKLESRHAASFNEAAERQMRRIAALNSRPESEWTADDYKLEKHALAMLRALTPFLELAATALRSSPHAAKTPDQIGENPSESAPDAPATLADGL